jgi:hypothetical protein
MIFEPTKKTYYRFPSVSSINDLDSKFYFPDKTYASGENSHFVASTATHSPNHKSYDSKIN